MKSVLATSSVIALAGAVKFSNTNADSPVSKVVTLLTDLKVKIAKDGELDKTDYDKYMNWCTEVQKSKKELIEEQSRTITTLEAEIVEGEAIDAKLEEDIEETVEKEHENEGASKEGAKDRTNDNHERQDEKAGNEKNLVDLKSATDTLKSAAPAGDTTAGGYTAKSDQIMGMITDQAETVQEEEETASKVEAKAQANFDGWITDMKAELGLLKKQEKKERKDEAETDEEIAQDTEMKDDTEEQREADAAFLKEAEKSCADREAEFQHRTKLRIQELEGVDQALKILDEKKDLFGKTFTKVPGAPTSFFQFSSSTEAHQAAISAYSALQAKVIQTHSTRLARLAVLVQKATPEAFGGVLKAIDDMMVTLKEEGASDKSKKDHCKQEYQGISKRVSNLGFLIQKNSATIDKIDARVEELNAEYAECEGEVTKLNEELKAMEDLRLEQHTNFQNDKADDETAINTLKETTSALSSYYEEHTGGVGAGSLVQYDPSKMSEKRKTLKRKEHQYTLTHSAEEKGAASGVVEILARIITNLEDEIADGQKTEAENQLAYEKDSGLLNESKDMLLKKMTSIENMKAQKAAAKSEEEDIKAGNEDSLKGQNQYKESIQEECDWILAKFTERFNKREAEMDGLVRAKELLSGASLVQQAKKKSSDAPKEGSLMKYLVRK